MTTHENGQRAPRHRAWRKRRRNYGPAIALALVCAAIFAAGYYAGDERRRKWRSPPCRSRSWKAPPPREASVAPLQRPRPPRRPCSGTDDIVTDGNLLDYDLQMTMQACCEKYGVPYALALAVADVESRFDPTATSGTNDYGLMQINQVNHGWLLEKALTP